jgi:RNA polymerase sigma-70 factor (ECF subfamily)
MLATLPAAQRFAVRLTGDRASAEDLLHDALVRAASSWRGFRGEASFRTWLFQIIVNAFRDALRRRGRAFDSIDDAPERADTSDPASAVAGEEVGAIVARHVSNLPPRQREVLVLVVYEELSPREAARVLGITESNARANLHFARQRLKRELAKYVGDVRRE